jgi:hypothetical protein
MGNMGTDGKYSHVSSSHESKITGNVPSVPKSRPQVSGKRGGRALTPKNAFGWPTLCGFQGVVRCDREWEQKD